jgi:hypothetical protein
MLPQAEYASNVGHRVTRVKQKAGSTEASYIATASVYMILHNIESLVNTLDLYLSEGRLMILTNLPTSPKIAMMQALAL